VNFEYICSTFARCLLDHVNVVLLKAGIALSYASYIQSFLLRAIAECITRLSHRLGVLLSVCHTRDLYQNGAR